VMKLLIILFINLLSFGRIRAQLNDSIVIVPINSKLSKDNIGYYFKLPFFPQSTVSTLVDELPKFLGGDDSLKSFISRNLKLPEIYLKSNLHGIVWIPLVIDENGKASFCGSIFCEEEFINEAHRLVGLMPKWKPAKYKKKNVYSDIIIPIYYSDN
ncbi:MAG: hypothetical protein ABL940_03595, partial [Bacteroidia bacterium]